MKIENIGLVSVSWQQEPPCLLSSSPPSGEDKRGGEIVIYLYSQPKLNKEISHVQPLGKHLTVRHPHCQPKSHLKDSLPRWTYLLIKSSSTMAPDGKSNRVSRKSNKTLAVVKAKPAMHMPWSITLTFLWWQPLLLGSMPHDLKTSRTVGIKSRGVIVSLSQIWDISSPRLHWAMILMSFAIKSRNSHENLLSTLYCLW